MLFRLVFLCLLVFMFLLPIYRVVKKKTIRWQRELEGDDTNLSDRFDKLEKEGEKLRADCGEEVRLAEEKANAARKIQKKMKG